MHTPNLLTFAAVLSSAAAQYKGFNTGSTLTDGSAKSQAVFESEFAAAKVLQGTSGFSSARLYTTIQAGTTSTPILAIPAAIAQDTSLLLGLWASGGQADFTNEIAALTSAISTYGTDFTSRVIGISVGSEDLYRTSVIGIAAEAGVGTTPDVLVSYINQLKSALASTALSSAKITHVDTYNAWTNGSNSAVISAVDFLSMDVYPYFQNTMTNSIDQGLSLFNTAYDETVSVAQGKDVWVTETGWPVSGPTENLAVASVANAKTYWDEVGCNTLFGKVNTFWYILQDAIPTLPSPSFGLVGTGSVSQAPLFNLTCPVASASASTAAAAASSTAATSSSVAGAAIVGAVSNSISSSAVVSSSAAAATSSSARAGLGAIASSQASNASSVSKSAATHASSATGKASSVSGAKTSSSTKTSSSATSSATTSSTISTGGGAVKTMSSSIAFVAIVALLANF